MWSTEVVFDELKPVLESAGYQVIAPTLPHHKLLADTSKEEQKILARTGLQDYEQYLGDIIEQLSVKPLIVGHSLGGILAQRLAQKYPIEGLILISTASPAGVNAWTWSVIKSFGHNFLKFPIWRSVTELSKKSLVYGVANSQTAELQQQLFEQLTYESGRVAFQLGFWFLFRNPPSAVDVDRISAPILMIAGTEDKITPYSVQKKTYKHLKSKPTFITIDGCCHWTLSGKYFDQVTSSIEQWLKEHQL
jgi:pimeloyl-ACP methyl ester carboxylesterase